jgi:pyocin large subunit-like protein
MGSRQYDPEIGRFISPDPIIPEGFNPLAYDRYQYVYSNPVRYTDSSGHCIDGMSTWICIALLLKAVDYGWTAWDTYQSGRVLANPDASRGDKLLASLNIGLAVLFEAGEPDDLLPAGLPLDDVGRRAAMSGAREAFEEGGEAALEKYIRENLGEHADDVLRRIGFNTSNFSGPEKLLEHFQKHGAEFGFQTADEYLQGARALTSGGKGIETITRANGDRLFYNAATNEFGVLSKAGVIRTYFKPVEGLDYWLRQIGR